VRGLSVLVAVVLAVAAGCALTRSFADAPSGGSAPSIATPTPSPAPGTPAGRHPGSPRLRALPPGVHRVSVGGRSFLLYVPRHVARPAPFMVMLGGIQWPAQMTMDRMRVSSQADATGGLVAFPEQVGGAWNAGRCCWGAQTDDVGFLHRIHGYVAKHFALDSTREVVAGFSNGGMMAYRAACDDPTWTAITVLGATLVERCAAAHPFTIVNVNGTADTSIAWNGGYSPRARYVSPPVWQMDQAFAHAFGCHAARTSTSGYNTVITYGHCRNGATVREIRVPGLRHHFPLKELDGYDFGPVLWQLAFG
jgi:polyhydroxybutyrate depolymerase